MSRWARLEDLAAGRKEACVRELGVAMQAEREAVAAMQRLVEQRQRAAGDTDQALHEQYLRYWQGVELALRRERAGIEHLRERIAGIRQRLIAAHRDLRAMQVLRQRERAGLELARRRRLERDVQERAMSERTIP